MKTITPPTVESLIDRQVRMWEVRNRLSDEGGEIARRELVHLAEGPWVTVSRQLGSNGLEIARKVASGLGWQTYNREILRSIAEHHHLREQVVQRLDERVVGWISENLTHLLAPRSLPQAAYVKETSEVVVALAKQGRAVIVGRGGNWLLDARYGLRVRIIAPFDTRVANVSREKDVSTDEAESIVREHDRSRDEYIRQSFGRSVDDPLGYDLILNTVALSIEDAAAIVTESLRRKLGGS